MKFILIIASISFGFLHGGKFKKPNVQDLPLKVREIHYKKDDFNQVLLKARMRKDLIFVYATADNCAPCNEFDIKMKGNKNLIKELNHNYVSVKMLKGDQNHNQFQGRYKLHQFPAVLFLDSHGTVIAKLVGKRKSQEVFRFAKMIRKEYDQE